MAKRDKTKDLFYNAIDYIVMTVIIIGIVTILGWRFELLFNKGKVDKDEKVATTKEVDVKESDLDTKTIDEVNKIDLEHSENKNNENTNNENAATEINLGENNNENNPTETNGNTEANNETETTVSNPPSETENKPNETNAPASGTDVTITIPSGTLPKGIGDILASAGLVESSEAFVKRLVELKLDTKLKSGEFKIKSGSNLDQVIQTLTK